MPITGADDMSQNITVTVTRTLNAPCERVWEVETAPQYFAQWFGAVPGSVEVDLRTGGEWLAPRGPADAAAVVARGGVVVPLVDVQPGPCGGGTASPLDSRVHEHSGYSRAASAVLGRDVDGEDACDVRIGVVERGSGQTDPV